MLRSIGKQSGKSVESDNHLSFVETVDIDTHTHTRLTALFARLPG